MNRAFSTTLLGLCLTALLAVPASAQINFDPVRRAYFVVGDAEMAAEVQFGSVVFVGKDDATNFATLPGSFTLTLRDRFLIGSPPFPGGTYPDGVEYDGVNTFGAHRTAVVAGPVFYPQIMTLHNFDNSTLDFQGGFAFFAFLNENSRLNLTGGQIGDAIVVRNASMNFMSGGKWNGVVNAGGTTNLSGGAYEDSEGSFDGIANVSGTVNLFGSGFTLSNTVAGQFARPYVPAVNGTYSTITGNLLDGTPLNTTLFLADGQTFNDRGGSSQDNPVLPDASGNGVFTFTDVPTGAWFDPPMVDSYLFTMTGDSLFTGILDFPTGFDAPFDVRVGNTVIGSFGAGESVDFADFGFASGVSMFSIENITPGVDAEDPTGFPIRLGFSSPFASFTMQAGATSAAAPEPGTAVLVLLGGVGVGVAARLSARRGGYPIGAFRGWKTRAIALASR